MTQLECFGGKFIYIELKRNLTTGLTSLDVDDVDVTEIELMNKVDSVLLFSKH